MNKNHENGVESDFRKINSERFIKERECELITCLSRTTRWRLERKGIFPEKYQISPGLMAYKYSEIENWIETRPIGRKKALNENSEAFITDLNPVELDAQ